MKYIKGLDTLRAFAVFLVIITHWGPRTFKSPVITFIFTRLIPDGKFGVDLFFVLSGYLITKILLNARNEALPDERLRIIKSFYIRRALRIFPIYFLLILFVAFILNDQFVKEHILYFFTYTSNFLVFKLNYWTQISHTWSLAVEEQFYIIWPWLIIFSPRKYLLGLILTALAIGVLSTIILESQYGEFAAVLLLPCITAFSIGALYAYVQLNPRFKKTVTVTYLVLLPACLVLLFVFQMGNKIILIRLVNSIIAINAIIYVVKENYGLIAKAIFSNRFLVNIGKISYGVYLYHYILPGFYDSAVNFLIRTFHLNGKLSRFLTFPPWSYLFLYAILFLISYLSYRFIETAFLRLKKKFSYLTIKKNP